MILIIISLVSAPPSIVWTALPETDLIAVETVADVNGNGTEDVVASPHFGSGSGLYCVDGLAGDMCLAASEPYPAPMACVALSGFLKGLRGVTTSWPKSVEEGEAGLDMSQGEEELITLPPGVYVVAAEEASAGVLRAVVLPAR